jgi:L-serine kinase (ADP)
MEVSMTSEAVLFPVGDLLETELTERALVAQVSAAILRAGCWTAPIIIEEISNAVMDGHHRLAAAKELGLRFVPCVPLSYNVVRVETHRPEWEVNPSEILRRAADRDLYPAKTTRHIFPRLEGVCSVSLAELRRDGPSFEAHVTWLWQGGRPPSVQKPGARYGHIL